MNKWQTALLFSLPTHDYILLPINSAIAPWATQSCDRESQQPPIWAQHGLRLVYTQNQAWEYMARHCWKCGPLMIRKPVTQYLIFFFLSLFKTLFFKHFHNYMAQEEESNGHTYIHPSPSSSSYQHFAKYALHMHIPVMRTYMHIFICSTMSKETADSVYQRFKWSNILPDL